MGTSTRLWAVGDMKPRDEAFGIAKQIDADKTIHRFLYLGDVYENGTVEDYAQRYEPVFGKFKYMTRPIPGNHDWHSKLAGYKSYWKDTPPFYWKDYGGWKVLFLDSNLSVQPGSPQYEYVKARAPQWKGPVIVCHHHHLYCAGGHGDQPQMKPILDLFNAHYCVGLSGHTHNMQLFKTFKNYTQIVVGCGGREMYPVNQGDGRLAWSSNDFGALRMDLSPDKLALAFVRHNGEVLHETELVPPKQVLMV
jgi:hypothetical protein